MKKTNVSFHSKTNEFSDKKARTASIMMYMNTLLQYFFTFIFVAVNIS